MGHDIGQKVQEIMRSAERWLAEHPTTPALAAGVDLARVLDSTEADGDRGASHPGIAGAADSIAEAWNLAAAEHAVLAALLQRRGAITSTHQLAQVTGIAHAEVPGLVLGIAPKLLRIGWNVQVASYGYLLMDPARRTLGPLALEGRTLTAGGVSSPVTPIEWLVARRLMVSHPHPGTGIVGSEAAKAVKALRAVLASGEVAISPPPWALVFRAQPATT